MNINLDFKKYIDKNYINELSRNIANGDIESGSELYNIMKYPLIKHIKGFGIKQQDVEDILQDIFLTYLKKLRRKIYFENCFGLIFKIADRQIYKYFKSKKDNKNKIYNDYNSVDENNEINYGISLILLKLTDRQKKILILRAKLYTEKEIAEKLKISISTVRRELINIKKFKCIFL